MSDTNDKQMEAAINSASKEELTLMLYEGAIKFCNQAAAAMEKGETQAADTLVQRVEDIIREFQMTLNFKYDISNQLNEVYNHMYNRLVEAGMGYDAAIMGEVTDMFCQLRDTWKDAINLSKEQQ
jgi:flagellar protein FliS